MAKYGNRWSACVVFIIAFAVIVTSILPSISYSTLPTKYNFHNTENFVDDMIKEIKNNLNKLKVEYSKINPNVRKWIEKYDLRKYDDMEILPDDFIDRNLSHFKEEKIADDLLRKRVKEGKPLFRVEIINELLKKNVIEEEWSYLTLKRKKWEVLHFLQSIEKLRKYYLMGNSDQWFDNRWYDPEVITSLENLCYELYNNINNWRLVYKIIYGIKGLEDLMYGPYNYHWNIESGNENGNRAGVNVTLHIVHYYSPSGDCNSGPDISFDVTIGGSSYSWNGPSDTGTWSGDITFSTTTTSSTISITIHTRERDSALCGGDDDFGTASLTYNVNTKKWSGASSVPELHTVGADGEAYVWFHIQSDSDNNYDVVSNGGTVAGYVITEYNGATNYNDPSDTYRINIDQNAVNSQQSIYIEMTCDSSLNADLYLYDSNSNLLASSTSAGAGGTEKVFYRLSNTDPVGYYIFEIRLVTGYGTYSATYNLYALCEVTVQVTGLQSESVTVSYKKMGVTQQQTLTSSTPSFTDYCDKNTVLSLSVPSGLYTYDPTSYTITQDSTITVHYYRSEMRIVINEISSYGTGNNEWIEIYNDGSETVYINGWIVTDQDGNDVTIPDAMEPMPPACYLMIYFGSGTNDYKFSDDGIARLYVNAGGDVLNDDGDDILILYEPGDKPIDYVAYSRGSGNIDVDSPPSGVTFINDGLGANGFAPAPYPGGSISLIPNGKDNDRAYDWYVTNSTSSTPENKNVNALSVSGKSEAPSEVGVGSTDVLLEDIYIEAIGGYMNVSQISVHLIGNATDSDISSLHLYKDTDNSGSFSSGDSLITSATFSGGTATFSGFVIPLGDGDSTYLFITADITNSSSAYGHSFSIQVKGEDIVLSPIQDVVVVRNPIVSSPTTIIPTDTTPPQVESYVVDPSKNVGNVIYVNQNFIVYFTFNEDMKTNVDPDISISENNVDIASKGWLDTRTYWVSLKVPRNVEENVDISIQNAKDIAGNPSPKYTISVRIDTLKPQVYNILFTKYSEYNGKIYVSKNFTISVVFSENMNTSLLPQISFTPTNVSYESIYWYGRTTLIMTFNISFNISSSVIMSVTGGYDLAGNSQVDYQFSFILDTIPPEAKIYLDKSSPVGKGEIHITIKFSEKMNTTLPIYVNFSGKSVKGEWINETIWGGDYSITTEYGNVTIEVGGAKDIAKNTMLPTNIYIIVDTKPPEVKEVKYSQEINEGNDLIIKVYATDEYAGVDKMLLWYKQGGSYVSVEMVKEGDYWYATIPGTAVHPPTVLFYIQAEDSVGNRINTSKYSVRVIPWYVVMWWLWLLLILIVILLILFIYYRKRRAKSQQIPLKESLAEKIKKKISKEEGEYDEFYE